MGLIRIFNNKCSVNVKVNQAFFAWFMQCLCEILIHKH